MGCRSRHPQQKCRVHGATAISLFIPEAPWVPRPGSAMQEGGAMPLACVRACPPTQPEGTPTSPGGEGCPSSLRAVSTDEGPQDGRGVEARLDSPARPGQGLVTPAKAARPRVPDESCSIPRGTASGRAGVSPPRRHPQSSRPARNIIGLGQVARPLSLCCPHLQCGDESESTCLIDVGTE